MKQTNNSENEASRKSISWNRLIARVSLVSHIRLKPYIFFNESSLMAHIISLIPHIIGFPNNISYLHKIGGNAQI